MSQQIYSAEDLLAGHVVVDKFSVEQLNIVQKFLEEKFSPQIDAIIKDFDDDENEDNHWNRTYLRRDAPLSFHMTIGSKKLSFWIHFDASGYHSYDEKLTSYDQVTVIFEDGVTTRSAYGTQTLDNIQRKRKIKYIAKLEPTIIEVLDRIEKIASEERVKFLENKLENKKTIAREHLDDLEEELEQVKSFQKKYSEHLKADETFADFQSIEYDLNKKIDSEKAKLKRNGLL